MLMSSLGFSPLEVEDRTRARPKHSESGTTQTSAPRWGSCRSNATAEGAPVNLKSTAEEAPVNSLPPPFAYTTLCLRAPVGHPQLRSRHGTSRACGGLSARFDSGGIHRPHSRTQRVAGNIHRTPTHERNGSPGAFIARPLTNGTDFVAPGDRRRQAREPGVQPSQG